MARRFPATKATGFEETMMSNGNSEIPAVNRLATGIRMATVIVVLGTLVAVWHPGMREAATAIDGTPAATVPATTPHAEEDTDTTYFPSRFPAPENVEPETPTF